MRISLLFNQDVLDDMLSTELEIKVDSDNQSSNCGRNYKKEFIRENSFRNSLEKLLLISNRISK